MLSRPVCLTNFMPAFSDAIPTVFTVPLSKSSGIKPVWLSSAEVAPVPPSMMVDGVNLPSEIRRPVPVVP